MVFRRVLDDWNVEAKLKHEGSNLYLQVSTVNGPQGKESQTILS
jgi:hypothetical protein